MNSHGWRSFFWLSTGLSAFVLILIVFLFPETKYHRTLPVDNTSEVIGDSSVHSGADLEIKA